MIFLITGLIVFLAGLYILFKFFRSYKSSKLMVSKKFETILLAIILLLIGSFLLGQKSRTYDQKYLKQSSSMSAVSSKKEAKSSSKKAIIAEKKAIGKGASAAQSSSAQLSKKQTVTIKQNVVGKEKLLLLVQSFMNTNKISHITIDATTEIHLSSVNVTQDTIFNEIRSEIQQMSTQYQLNIKEIVFYNSENNLIKRFIL